MLASVYNILVTYHQAFFAGLLVTLKLSLIVWGVGISLGAVLGYMGWRHPATVGMPSRIASFVLGGIPILVFLFWLHYPAQAVMNVVIDPFYTAAFTFTVINVFAVADLVRVACADFPQQYILAARVSGMTGKQIAWKIQLPLLVQQLLPGLMLLQVTMLHVTLFASLISVDELFRAAQRINAMIYKPVEIYTALGLFFLAVCLPINGLALALRKKFGRNLSEH
ncbi:MAG: ABC transporter permease subunit [Alphaproteobacteria bacterium]|nr:ABC transporter permease subunit [Alphaproteobacteria bacterium]